MFYLYFHLTQCWQHLLIAWCKQSNRSKLFFIMQFDSKIETISFLRLWFSCKLFLKALNSKIDLIFAYICGIVMMHRTSKLNVHYVIQIMDLVQRFRRKKDFFRHAFKDEPNVHSALVLQLLVFIKMDGSRQTIWHPKSTALPLTLKFHINLLRWTVPSLLTSVSWI